MSQREHVRVRFLRDFLGFEGGTETHVHENVSMFLVQDEIAVEVRESTVWDRIGENED
jgi:hypothetical protein